MPQNSDSGHSEARAKKLRRSQSDDPGKRVRMPKVRKGPPRAYSSAAAPPLTGSFGTGAPPPRGKPSRLRKAMAVMFISISLTILAAYRAGLTADGYPEPRSMKARTANEALEGIEGPRALPPAVQASGLKNRRYSRSGDDGKNSNNNNNDDNKKEGRGGGGDGSAASSPPPPPPPPSPPPPPPPPSPPPFSPPPSPQPPAKQQSQSPSPASGEEEEQQEGAAETEPPPRSTRELVEEELKAFYESTGQRDKIPVIGSVVQRVHNNPRDLYDALVKRYGEATVSASFPLLMEWSGVSSAKSSRHKEPRTSPSPPKRAACGRGGGGRGCGGRGRGGGAAAAAVPTPNPTPAPTPVPTRHPPPPQQRGKLLKLAPGMPVLATQDVKVGEFVIVHEGSPGEIIGASGDKWRVKFLGEFGEKRPVTVLISPSLIEAVPIK